MATVHDILSRTQQIVINPRGPAVLRSTAGLLRASFCPAAAIVGPQDAAAACATLSLSVSEVNANPESKAPGRATLRRDSPDACTIAVSREHLLYFFATVLARDWRHVDIDEVCARTFTPAFPVLRPSFDLLLTQWGRSQRGFSREEYARTLAENGFTHAEVNGLAFPLPAERGPAGEVYSRFYTYCPALDQFVSSALNRGMHPEDYLQANLNALRANADAAALYGLSSAITCFEPRSVSDELLRKYPHLRGARVDHPMRSFHPRYNLSIGHPVVREHYAELLRALLAAVPRIDTMSVWSNDSGAGFEYTSSLYVGRNGGGYVIREWKGAADIAEAAALNIHRFMRLLRDTGRETNPAFRVLLRLEPFWEEMDHLWSGFEDGIDVEVSSLLSRGWRLDYRHPRHPEAREIHLTALHNHFLPDESGPIAELRGRKSDAHVYFSAGVSNNHEPLLGIPFPWLAAEKLADLGARGVTGACAMGGVAPPSLAPWDINREVVRAAQAGLLGDLDTLIRARAAEWVGDELADDLVAVWRASDEAYRDFPVPIWIYSSWGVWYRLLTRPLVPDIEALPEADRRYYEDHLLSTSHNRARIDLRYDVGFDLVDPTHARHCASLMDKALFPRLDAALARLAAMRARAAGTAADTVRDIADRMTALRCWYRNQRNAALWVAGVHGWLEAGDDTTRADCAQLLHDMVLDEIENSRALRSLWIESRTNWMMLSESGESTFMYGNDFGEHLQKKIELMQGRENDTPRVDPDFQWRVPGLPG